jgi:hypothetical protein
MELPKDGIVKELPKFQRRQFDEVHKFIAQLLTNPNYSIHTCLVELQTFDDGHFRALFKPEYFVLEAEQHSPTKSQWNTFKKRLKRHNPAIFVFKEHGAIEHQGQQCYYVDFGFLTPRN